jgi:hypothetical protein
MQSDGPRAERFVKGKSLRALDPLIAAAAHCEHRGRFWLLFDPTTIHCRQEQLERHLEL